MLKGWVSAGQDPDLYWSLTYREIDAVIRGAAERNRREHNELAWAAWHQAYLTAYAPRKSTQFTKLKDMLDHGPPVPKRRMTGDELIEATKVMISRAKG